MLFPVVLLSGQGVISHRVVWSGAAEAISCLEKSLQIAGSVHGRNHPVMESFWLALAEAKTEVSILHSLRMDFRSSRQAIANDLHSMME